MRILQVYMGPYVANKGGGVSVYVRNISERLAKKHDVTVFATNPGNLPRFEVVNGVRVERFRCFAPSGAYYFSIDMLLRLRRANFDVIHGHCYNAFPMHFAALARRKIFVVSTHFGGGSSSMFRNVLLRLFKRFGKRTLLEANKIIAVSFFERDLLIKDFKIDPEKITLIPCGVNLSEFKVLRKHKRDFRSILYVSNRLDKFKGACYLIDVLPKLDSDVILEIVGNGVVLKSLEKYASRRGVLNRVRFYSYMPQKELFQRYVDADLFVLLSKYESYSMVVAEALAAGTPCIVSRTAALNEWIDNETCFGVDFPVNINELARLITFILHNGADKNKMKKWIGTKILDWDDVVKRLENVYHGC